MAINGKDVKLTYSGGAGASVIPTMHVAISTPTFIIHEERKEKWAALTKSMEKPCANQMTKPLSSFNSANQNRAQMSALNAPVPALINDVYPDQSACRFAATDSASAPDPPPSQTHACKRCTFATSSNRKLRHHRCPCLHEHRRRGSIGPAPGKKSLEKAPEKHLEKWIALGATRRAWKG